MKKIIFPLALLSAISFTQIAAAQSNVTVYGAIDLGVGRAVNSGTYGVLQGAASRLGFKGEEDLGSGWKSSFHLQHRFNADTGAVTNPDKFWHGDSWVGLEGPYGQVRLGRMYTAAYEYVMLPADVFVHSRTSSNITSHTGDISAIRFDNSLNYNVQRGGLRLGMTFSPNENIVGTRNAYSAALSYTTSKFYLAAGREKQNLDHAVWNTVTGQWGDDALKLVAFYGSGTNSLNQDIRAYSIGASGKVGAGSLMASFARMDNKDLNTKVQNKLSVGYYYNLSKRSQVYTNIAHDRAFKSNRNGFDMGIFHTF